MTLRSLSNTPFLTFFAAEHKWQFSKAAIAKQGRLGLEAPRQWQVTFTSATCWRRHAEIMTIADEE
jgi:hypothetical protein